MPKPRPTKEAIYVQVLSAAIELDFKKGHQKWTMSDLSRASKIGRSLIYYYFGKSRESLLLDAVKMIGEDLFGLSPSRLELWKQGRMIDSILISKKFAEQGLHLGAFYLAHRYKDSVVGKAIRDLENRQARKLQQFYPRRSEDDLRMFLAFFMGIVFAPETSEATARKAAKLLLRFG